MLGVSVLDKTGGQLIFDGYIHTEMTLIIWLSKHQLIERSKNSAKLTHNILQQNSIGLVLPVLQGDQANLLIKLILLMGSSLTFRRRGCVPEGCHGRQTLTDY